MPSTFFILTLKSTTKSFKPTEPRLSMQRRSEIEAICLTNTILTIMTFPPIILQVRKSGRVTSFHLRDPSMTNQLSVMENYDNDEEVCIRVRKLSIINEEIKNDQEYLK